MNIHPIFVHFPIALLTLYAIAELLRFKKLMAQPYYFYVKAVLLISGTLFSFLALQTGEMAQEVLQERSSLIEMHSTYATISVWIFVILSILYINLWISKTDSNNKLLVGPFAKIWNIKMMVTNRIMASHLQVLLALIGLVTITITGALGGAIVYGQTVDPFVNFIYNLVM